MTLPIERYKEAYKNWRWNPFTSADMAVDKEEDGLFIPSGSPFIIQLLEVPRHNDPTSVAVRCYGVDTFVDETSASGQKVLKVDDTTDFSPGNTIIINRGGDREEEKIIDTVQAGISLTITVNLTFEHTAVQADVVEKYITFTETAGTPAQSQFRVDYPPADGEGTGLVEFNLNDATKEVRINYKATGSPALAEYLDTKVSYPVGTPNDNQIIGFVSGAPDWRNNSIRYFHEGSVIYHASGEDESCLLFRFKKLATEAKVFLELKGAKLHQGYYTELFEHNHGVGTLGMSSASGHTHAKGTLAGSQPTHTHGAGTLAAVSAGIHSHGTGTLAGSQPNHAHAKGTLAGSQPQHEHYFIDYNPGVDDKYTNPAGDDAVTIAGSTAQDGDDAVSISGATADAGAHGHSISGATAAGGDDAVTIAGSTASAGVHSHTMSGSTANAGTAAKTYPDQLKVYINGVDKTTDVLAKTGLTQFGDGTSSHAFVTTGSGEMDISDLITTNQIHEIKVTESISAKGGRCLLHLELY